MYEMPKADAPMLLPGAVVTAGSPPTSRGPDWTTLNINNRVRVKLRDDALVELRRQDDELCARMPDAVAAKWRAGDAKRYQLDSEGYVAFQLWDLMQRLGHMMVMGCEPPVDPTILVDLRS